MTAIFGKPPRVYHGPYPNETLAKELTDAAAATQPEEFLKGELKVNGNTVSIGKKRSSQILDDLDQSEFELGDKTVQRSVQAATYKESCLVVRVKTKDTFFNANPADDLNDRSNHDGCILFDLNTMRAFARYSFHGSVPRFPRLLLEN
jgi:hypothetical protein